MTIVLHPSRIRHNGDTGADVQQGAVPRILCLLLIYIPQILSITEKDVDVLACGHARIMHVPGHQGLITKGTV